jgi:hypothetical protein
MYLHILRLDDFSVERVRSSVYVLRLPVYKGESK